MEFGLIFPRTNRNVRVKDEKNNIILETDAMLENGDKRTFLGAVAGVVVDDEARKYALNQGLYLIEPAGSDLNITPPNGNPKEW